VSDPTYRKLLGNFNSITPENVAKFQFIHPLPGQLPMDFNFAEMDALVSIAKKAGMKVHGHALVFGEANPQWVQSVARDDPGALKGIMINHIATVVSRYKGEIEGWDVVDEPLADYGAPSGQFGLRENIWYKAMGPEYIVAALKAAHAADPSTGLWLNDFGMESDPDRFQEMVTLVRWLQAQKVPLTGIGFEAHIDDGDTTDNDTQISIPMLESRLDTLKSLGLKARFSELDVTNASEYPVFGDVVRACLARSNCTGVTTWGITDKYASSGTVNGDGSYSTGVGLPWDSNERPTPAVGYIRQALGGQQ
jgi:endo-1,4-beta-xylanase